MGQVIDFFTKKPLKRTDTYFDRFEKCHENILKYGKCECDLCVIKRAMAYKTVNFAYKKMIEFNKTTENVLTWGDLLEVLITASKTTREYIDKSKGGPTDESKI